MKYTIIVFATLIILARALKITDWRYVAVFLFVSLNLLVRIVPSNEFLYGFISPENITILCCLIGMIFIKPVRLRFIDNQKKQAILLLLIFNYFFTYYLAIKAHFFYGAAIEITFNTFLRDILYSTILIMLVKRINDEKSYTTVMFGLITGAVLAAVSIVFAEYLSLIGFDPNIGFSYEGEFIGRPSGFLGGDANVAGMFCAVHIALIFVLIREKYFNKIGIYIAIASLILLLIAIMRTGSRTAFAATSLQIFLFYRKQGGIKRIITILFISALVYYMLISFGDLLAKRLTEALKDPNRATMGSRISYWRTYMADLFSHIEYFIVGNLNQPPIYRNPHNYYLRLLYFAGLMPFIFYLSTIKKFIFEKPVLEGRARTFNLAFPIIAYALTIMAIGDPPSIYLSIIIALSSGYSK